MDFPGDPPTPLHVSCVSRYSVAAHMRALGSTLTTAAAPWPAAGQASYIPFALPWHYPVRRMFWGNGSSVGGTVTIGLYTKDGANLYRSAAITTVGATNLQYTPVLSPDLLLTPGMYYIGIAFSATTGASLGGGNITAPIGRLIGLLQQATIPAAGVAATFAAWNSAGGGFPMCGFTRTDTGF